MSKPYAVSVSHDFADSLALNKLPSNTSGGRTRSVLYPTHVRAGHFSLRSNRRRQQSLVPLKSLCLDGLPRFSPAAKLGDVSHGENPRAANNNAIQRSRVSRVVAAVKSLVAAR